MTVADLDGNGNPELVVAVTSSQQNEFFEQVPVSTYIYVFEKKKNRYRYMWKSGPLSYLNMQKNMTGEKISDILSNPNMNDHSVLLIGERNGYKLEFIDGYYVMNPSEQRIAVNNIDKNMVEYLEVC